MKVTEAIQGNCDCSLTELQKCLRHDTSIACHDQITQSPMLRCEIFLTFSSLAEHYRSCTGACNTQSIKRDASYGPHDRTQEHAQEESICNIRRREFNDTDVMESKFASYDTCL